MQYCIIVGEQQPEFPACYQAAAYANVSKPRRPDAERVTTQTAEDMERSVQAALRSAAAARARRSRRVPRRQQQQQALFADTFSYISAV